MKGTIQIRDVVFFYFINFWGLFTRKDHLTHHNVFKYIYFHDSYQLYLPKTDKISRIQCGYEFRPAFPTSVKKVNTSFKYVWRTWGPALPTLLADLMIFCPLSPISDEFQKLCYRRCYLSQVVSRNS